MSRVEFLRWMDFYECAPFDDRHRYHRPAGLVAQSMGGGKMDEMLDWLADDRSGPETSDADMNTLRAFGYVTDPRKKGGG